MSRKWKYTAVGILAAMVTAACFVMPGCGTENGTSMVSSSTLPDGVTISGVDVSGMSKEQAIQAVATAQPDTPAYQLTLKLKDKTWSLTEKDLSLSPNTEAVIDEILADYSVRTRGSSLPKTYEVKYEVDYEALNQKLDKLAEEEMNHDPVDATVDSFDSASGSFKVKDGEKGVKVKTEELHTAVKDALDASETAEVEVPFEEIDFTKTAEEVKKNMQKLGSYTTVSTNNANGNHNMKLALSAANGTVLQPGEIFSFNSKTGNTTNASQGYRKAGAIVGGKLVEEYGGGICQASTTIYGAALRSNMKILTRYNHTWPSSYCPIGQDAAVSYGSLDFRFQNTSEYPVYIVAGMNGTTLSVTFYGYQDPSYDEIKVTSQQTGTVSQPADIYQLDKSMEKGKIVKERTGRVGKRASAQRVYYKNGAVVKRENLPSSYYRELATLYKHGPDAAIPGSTSSTTSEVSSVVSSEVSSSSAPSSTPTPSSSTPAPVSSTPAPSVPESSTPEPVVSQPEPPADNPGENSAAG